MRLLQWAARHILKAADVGGWNVSNFQQGRPYVPRTKLVDLVKKYRSYVHACTRINAITCADVPLRLFSTRKNSKQVPNFPTKPVSKEHLDYLSGQKGLNSKIAQAAMVEEVFEHPLLDLLSKVNEFMNGFDLFENLYSYIDLVGNSYWYMVPNNIGQPIELWPLMPQYMKVLPDKQLFIKGWEYKKTPDSKVIIPPELVIQFKTFNPTDVFYGLGALEAAIVAADLGLAMNLYETNVFKNNAHFDVAVKLPIDAGEPGDEKLKEMEKHFRQLRSGVKNAGKVPFLTGGAEIESLQFKPKEMAFLKGRQASLQEVAAIFGVPMSMLTPDNVNKANAEIGEHQHAKNTVKPRLTRVQQKLNERLTPLYDPNLFLAYDNPVPEDKEFRLTEIESNLKTGKTTINEERQRDNQEPVQWGGVPILPMNMIPLGSQPLITVPANNDPAKTKGNPPLNVPAVNFVNQEQVNALIGYFADLGKEILEGFDRDAEVLGKAVKVSEDDLVSGWFDMQKWNRILAEVNKPFLKATILNGGERALLDLTSERVFDPLDSGVLDAIQKHESSYAAINATTNKEIKKRLAAGIAEGEGVTKLRNRIVDQFAGNRARIRATTIARTETIFGFNAGKRQGYIQSRVVTRMEWVATGDERTCQWCPTMDGKTIEVRGDGNYHDMGTELVGSEGGILHFDYEPIGHPPLHPMCRCTVVPIVDKI